MNRLLMAVPSGKTWSYTYAYDRYGNRWQQNLIGTGGSGPQFSTTFDANNHVSDSTVSYDAAGNVMQDASNTYTYDSQNQMISSLSRSSGVLTCYFYDAFGRRVQKTTGATSCGYPFVGGTSLYYVYDTAGNMIDEVSAPSGGTGNWTRQEIYAAGRHLATFNASAGQAYWDFSDWLGTERARVNAVTGAVAETCTSLPWGDNLQCTGADQSPLHFTGKQRDSESGLDNFDVRYFGPSFGRFMRPDPDNAGARLENPQSWNAYLYVLNNPLIFSDPFGLDCIYTPGASGNPNPREDGHATIVPGDCINAGGKDDGGVFVDNNKDNPVQQSDITFSQDGSVGVVAYTPANGVGMAYSCIGNCPSDTVQVNAAPPGTPTMSVAPLPDNLQPPILQQQPTTFWQRLAIDAGCFAGLSPDLVGPMRLQYEAPSSPPNGSSKETEGQERAQVIGPDGRPLKYRNGRPVATNPAALAGGVATAANTSQCIANAARQ